MTNFQDSSLALRAACGAEFDILSLSLHGARLQAVCDEMGAALRHSAFSPNIKDRLDYSCAIFDADGELVAQAAHIPVHLGSMAYAMRDLVRAVAWAPGDMLIVNDPFLGGTHLPDVTLVAPVFAGEHLVAFVANRAHHADIGCPRPGSMPLARTLEDEGMVIPPRKLLIGGRVEPGLQAELLKRLRNPRGTLGDISAQVSANRCGIERLSALIDSLSPTRTALLFAALNDYGERIARAALGRLPAGCYEAQDRMDDNAGYRNVTLRARVTVGDGSVEVDFRGSSNEVDGNINCPLPVTAAAVYYVFYCLMARDTPACAGSMRPLSLRVPPCSLLNANRPAAVAAGNVETSQRIVDVLLAALAPVLADRIPAASCGTMNNVAMGGPGWDYYETIGGGGGAHARARGQDAIHTHMTNTLNTPIEVLEANFPLRVMRYSVRDGSGGEGHHRGGHGIVREYTFLAPAAVTLLTERRHSQPWGLVGGSPGRAGENRLNGELLPGMVEIDVAPGDHLSIASPGGGGWGTP